MNCIDKIHSLDKFGSRPGLDRIKRFLDILGNPQDRLRFVHVAGTNGKGSVCALISSTLTAAGYKTGLFISPYITDFCERIQVNGRMIPVEVLENAVERTFPIIEQLREDDCIITEFEYVMALEFLIHSEAKCDIVVLETGLGGLLDCTNVIKPPLCSVITRIGLDHTAVLGDTIEEITIQKCGIIKPSSMAVTSAQDEEVMRIIVDDCRAKGVSLVKSGGISIKILEETIDGTKFEYNNSVITLPLIGSHQIENAKTALSALESIKADFPVSPDDIKIGFKNAVNPARFEVLSKNPLVILDGAHNPNGVCALKNALEKYVNKKPKLLVIGMLADKDSRSSLSILSGKFRKVYTVPVNNPRTLSSDELARECKSYFDNVESLASVFEAIDSALVSAKQTDCALVIAGSLYLAGEARSYIFDKL
jgi:dihydrofolate synthase/folylpolyglutamate synthase